MRAVDLSSFVFSEVSFKIAYLFRFYLFIFLTLVLCDIFVDTLYFYLGKLILGNVFLAVSVKRNKSGIWLLLHNSSVAQLVFAFLKTFVARL